MLTPLLMNLGMFGDAEEVEAAPLSLVARPTDFVISPPYYMHQIQAYRKLAQIPDQEAMDKKERREMLQLYTVAMDAMRAAR